MNLEDVQSGDWLKVGLQLDPVRFLNALQEHGISPKAKGSYYAAHAYPMYHYCRFPGGFAINDGDRHWMMLAHLDRSQAVIRFHRLDYDASTCEAQSCTTECSCPEWDDDDDEWDECDYCAYGCSCEACNHGEDWCITHEIRHPRLN